MKLQWVQHSLGSMKYKIQIKKHSRREGGLENGWIYCAINNIVEWQTRHKRLFEIKLRCDFLAPLTKCFSNRHITRQLPYICFKRIFLLLGQTQFTFSPWTICLNPAELLESDLMYMYICIKTIKQYTSSVDCKEHRWTNGQVKLYYYFIQNHFHLITCTTL